MPNSMRVIAIDPGYDRVGIAVLEKTSARERETVIHSECFTTSKNESMAVRLNAVGSRVAQIILDHHPEFAALETLYFSKNQKTALSVAEARGVLVYECARAGLTLFEYPPSHIKIAITGHGASTKHEIMGMIPRLVTMKKIDIFDDEFDAIAVGITCIAHEYSRLARTMKS